MGFRNLRLLALAHWLTGALLTAPPAIAHEASVEGGVYSAGYNMFRIPNLGGTKVTFNERDHESYFRVTAKFQISENSFIRLLAFPLNQTFYITPNAPLNFNNRTFAAGEKTEVYYKFGSYRASYLYRFPISEKIQGQVGGVAKMRIAKIALKSPSAASEYTNVGFVPLLNLGAYWTISRELEFRFDMDGLAAKNGRAIDASAEIFYKTGPADSGLSAGYRLLEGGADTEVYTFALFHFLYVGYTLSF